jgi:DNA-binding response OmpR family regulator
LSRERLRRELTAMDRPRRILIVDDEPNVRLMFRTSLASTADGAVIGEAEDGDAALEKVEDASFDVIILDLQMPGVDGMETLRRLRARGDNTPVVVVTAHGEVPHAVEAMKLGAVDFLAKPLTPDTLRRVVAEVCDRSRRAEQRGTWRDPAPENATQHFATNLARAKRAINRRDFDSAEVCLKLALALRDDSADAHNLMGVLLEVREDREASYRSYCAALKADPTYEPARQNMRRFRESYSFGRSSVPMNTGDA